jgi:hypothetical protein
MYKFKVLCMARRPTTLLLSLSPLPFSTTTTMSAHVSTPGIHLQNLVLDESFTAEQKADCVSDE